MKHTIAACVTTILLLLILVIYLLLKLAHVSIQCEVKGSFNQTEIAVPSDSLAEPLLTPPSGKKAKTPPLTSKGIEIPAPAPPLPGDTR